MARIMEGVNDSYILPPFRTIPLQLHLFYFGIEECLYKVKYAWGTGRSNATHTKHELYKVEERDPELYLCE